MATKENVIKYKFFKGKLTYLCYTTAPEMRNTSLHRHINLGDGGI